jgi:OFA family oxalate/formate antiporter-like MFS transporter
MLLGIGTSQAWSVFVTHLRAENGLSALQAQLVFSTCILTFCGWMLVAGRLHDRFGPRRVAFGGALVIGLGYLVTYTLGRHFLFLWLGMGVLAGMGNATVYTCPIATAIRWFPRRRGLVAGLAAACFGAGPILVQLITVPLLERGWPVLRTIGLLGAMYVPTLLALSLLLRVPDAEPAQHARVMGFRGRALLRDARFWTLFVGMLCGTFPYLVMTGNARLMASAWQVGPQAVAWAIPALALGNAAGRILWGAALDCAGTRPAMWAAQSLAVMATSAVLWTGGSPGFFLTCLAAMGLCYGSNFAIYPGTIVRLYGVELLGSVYPWVMVAQGVSSFGPTVAGLLSDITGSYKPGLLLAAGVAGAGLVAGLTLGRRQRDM